MAFTNSPLATYTNISPSHTSGRWYNGRSWSIDTITIHCAVGQASARGICNYLAQSWVGASANYFVGCDGSIAQGVYECDRSWCTSSGSNDARAITIEVASDTYHPYAITDAAYEALIRLCADICLRNNIKELKWRADSSLIGRPDLQNMTAHRWFASKACPGDYIYNREGQIAARVNEILNKDAESKKAAEEYAKQLEQAQLAHQIELIQAAEKAQAELKKAQEAEQAKQAAELKKIQDEARKELERKMALTAPTPDNKGKKKRKDYEIFYRTYVEWFSWLGWVGDKEISGTQGQKLRMEAIQIDTNSTDVVKYRTYVQGDGWHSWSTDMETSGTKGEKKRIEAIQIKLTGELKETKDVYYRVHCQSYGWLDWACNGQTAGTQGLGKRMEAIQICLVDKGAKAPGATNQPYIKKK